MSAPWQIDDLGYNWQRMTAIRREAMMVCAAILAVAMSLILWVFLTRKRRQRRSRHHGSNRPAYNAERTSDDSSEPATALPRRRKWRRRRRDHRPRNPTLAETGGLPPVRPDGPPQTMP